MILTGALLGVPFSTAHAATTQSSFYGSLMQMAWGLFIVLGIILILYAIARKKLSLLQTGGDGTIKVVSTRHLMPKKSLFLVEVKGREYLLASGGDSLQLISEIKPDKNEQFSQIMEETVASGDK